MAFLRLRGKKMEKETVVRKYAYLYLEENTYEDKVIAEYEKVKYNSEDNQIDFTIDFTI